MHARYYLSLIRAEIQFIYFETLVYTPTFKKLKLVLIISFENKTNDLFKNMYLKCITTWKAWL